MVLVEIAWVLRACYGIGRVDVARALRALLETRQLRVERAALVVRALRRQLAANADFSDALIIELARAHGCQEVVSFDRQYRKGIVVGPIICRSIPESSPEWPRRAVARRSTAVPLSDRQGCIPPESPC